jgi:hypothetical protein
LIVFNSRNCIEKIKKEREVEALKIARFLYESVGGIGMPEKTEILIMKKENLDDVLRTWSSIAKKRFSYFFDEEAVLKIYLKNKDYKEFFTVSTKKLARSVVIADSLDVENARRLELVKKFSRKIERVFFPIKIVHDRADLIKKISQGMGNHKTPILVDVCASSHIGDERKKLNETLFDSYFKNELSKKTKVYLHPVPDKQKK